MKLRDGRGWDAQTNSMPQLAAALAQEFRDASLSFGDGASAFGIHPSNSNSDNTAALASLASTPGTWRLSVGGTITLSAPISIASNVTIYVAAGTTIDASALVSPCITATSKSNIRLTGDGKIVCVAASVPTFTSCTGLDVDVRIVDADGDPLPASKISCTDFTNKNQPNRTNTIVLLGDSITNQNVITPGSGYGECYHAAGYFVQANIELGWPFRIVADLGVSGDTTAQILARVGDVLAYKPSWCCVMGGINDVAGVSYATTITNLTAIYTALQSAGISVLACTIIPADAHTTTPAYGYKRRKINEWIKWYATQTSGIVVADTERAIVNPDTGGPASNMTTDGTHPTNIGARRMGRAIVAALGDFAAAVNPGAGYDNGYVINPMAKGSNAAGAGGFTAPAGITGVGPNGWDGFVRNTGAAVGSKVTRSGDWRPESLLRLACTFTAGFDGAGVCTGGSDRGGVAKGRYDQSWAANTAYALNDRKKPTAANGYHYVVTVAGTSHATTEPTWPTTEGATITDGTITWRCHATPVNGDQFYAVCEFDASSLVGGAQPVLTLHHGYTDGTFQDLVACGYIDLASAYGAAPDHIPSTGVLVTPTITLDLSAKTLRYLYARLAVYGPASGTVNVDVTRLDLIKV